MEELFCIGCGAQIQTEDKEKAGYTPASSIKRLKKRETCTANAVSAFVITMKLWMSISQMTSFKAFT